MPMFDKATYNTQYYKDNKEDIAKQKKVYDKAHAEKKRCARRKWGKSNKDKIRLYGAKRRAVKLQRTPGWLTKEQLQQIKDFYINCPEGLTVDHIIPLQGKFVSGLHHPDNLQYLTSRENHSKGNKYTSPEGERN